MMKKNNIRKICSSKFANERFVIGWRSEVFEIVATRKYYKLTLEFPIEMISKNLFEDE